MSSSTIEAIRANQSVEINSKINKSFEVFFAIESARYRVAKRAMLLYKSKERALGRSKKVSMRLRKLENV